MSTKKVRSKRDRQAEPIERKIYFYRISVGENPDHSPKPFETQSIFDAISSLSFESGDRYLDDREGNSICCWIEDKDTPARVRLAKIRRSDLPAMEHSGRLSPLDMPVDAGLAEQTHLVVFPDNIIGVEFNFHGPRPTRFTEYIRKKCPGLYPTAELHLLVRNNVLEQIRKVRSINYMRLHVKASYADRVAQADESLGASLRAASEATGAEDIELILKPAPYSKGTLTSRAITLVKKLATFQDLRENASAFSVSGIVRSESPEDIDILKDGLVISKKIARARPGTSQLDKESAFQAIEDAYNAVRHELSMAPGVT